MSMPGDAQKPLPIARAIESRWGAERAEQALREVHVRRVRRIRLKRSALLAVSLFVLGSAGAAWRAHVMHPEQTVVDAHRVRFGDGSTVRLLDANSTLEVGRASESAVEVSLRSGRAEFEITPNPARRFVVHAGAADVTVLGTHFLVARETARVRVEVVHGRVSVEFVGGKRLLTDGESNWFPPSELSETVAARASAAPAVSALPTPGTSATPSSASSAIASADPRGEHRRFLEHAAHGEYAEAYAAIERAPDAVNDSARELLLAADAARFSGHPLPATRFLERVTREHARDSVAPLAAFTLGRLYLIELGQPAKAADAFELSLSLSPGGSLAEDSLARAVEAAAGAGQSARARSLAEQYIARFPHGRRLENVQRSAGLLGDGSPNP
jgi:transmembrane sensor